jgi:hypothetical protein
MSGSAYGSFVIPYHLHDVAEFLKEKGLDKRRAGK